MRSRRTSRRRRRAAIPACPSTTLGFSSLSGDEGTEFSSSEFSNSELTDPEKVKKVRKEKAESRPVEEVLASSVFAIDWYESGGVIDWNTFDNRERFSPLLEAQQAAVNDKGRPQLVELAGRSVLVHPRGMGTDRQSRMEYRLEWAGVTIGLSPRLIATRQNANFYLKATGESCVLHGVDEVRRVVEEIVTAIGGTLRDEWVKRIDLCLDLPGLAVQEELQQAFDGEQFLTTFRQWRPFDGVGGKKGFSLFGAGACTVNVYDKLADAFERHDGVYQLAMKSRRWGGITPEAATRVEYQLRRPWLSRYRECASASSVFENLGTIVGKLVNTGTRPLFMLTDRTPDKKNKHQSRCEVLPLWAAIARRFQDAAGEPRGTLTPIPRWEAAFPRLYAMGVGALTSAAAKMGLVLESPADVATVVEKLMENAGVPANDLAKRWARKSHQTGTHDDLMSFPPKAA
jgi:hypothetical protein